MKLVSYADITQRVAIGLLQDSKILDLAAAGRRVNEAADLSSMLAVIRGGEVALAALRRIQARGAEFSELWTDVAQVRLLAPIPNPVRNVFCVGRNYLDHVKEGYAKVGTDLKLPQVPQFFTKATHAVNGPHGDIRYDPRVTQLLDYEVELAVVLGRGGRDIPKDQALDHVFGYTVANDVTARDLQRRHEQWFKGKSLDTTCPLGPCLVDRGEIGDPRTLELSLSVNGVERQRARVAQMIFDIPTIISSLSAGLTLDAGDIIATGTPAGVGFAMTPAQALKGGDQIVARIDRIGELNNRVVAV